MYHAALRLSPEGIYLTAKMVFIEMLRTGITTVGEFHYVHNRPNGRPYSDRNEIAKQVLRAAREVGIRDCLLRVAYGRSGYKTPPNPLQRRFIEPDVDTFLCSVEALAKYAKRYGDGFVSIGVAPHSIRAVDASWMNKIAEYARMASIPCHMHACEQREEILQSKAEYGMEPIEFLADLRILGPGFTGVHCTHLNRKSKRLLAKSGACISACPTTERNLGDGVFDAAFLLNRGVPVGLGTDSQCQVNLFEDMRLLEYNLRLVRERRNLIFSEEDQIGGEILVAPELFRTAAKHGGVSLKLAVGGLKVGLAGDFFTIDLHDLALAGWDDGSLLSKIVFALDGRAVRDVVVGGKVVVDNGRHSQESVTLRAYDDMSRRLWEDL
jgi:formimidoylglutamate deiminase